jgi:hypothetical protein
MVFRVEDCKVTSTLRIYCTKIDHYRSGKYCDRLGCDAIYCGTDVSTFRAETTSAIFRVEKCGVDSSQLITGVHDVLMGVNLISLDMTP